MLEEGGFPERFLFDDFLIASQNGESLNWKIVSLLGMNIDSLVEGQLPVITTCLCEILDSLKTTNCVLYSFHDELNVISTGVIRTDVRIQTHADYLNANRVVGYTNYHAIALHRFLVFEETLVSLVIQPQQNGLCDSGAQLLPSVPDSKALSIAANPNFMVHALSSVVYSPTKLQQVKEGLLRLSNSQIKSGLLLLRNRDLPFLQYSTLNEELQLERSRMRNKHRELQMQNIKLETKNELAVSVQVDVESKQESTQPTVKKPKTKEGYTPGEIGKILLGKDGVPLFDKREFNKAADRKRIARAGKGKKNQIMSRENVMVVLTEIARNGKTYHLRQAAEIARDNLMNFTNTLD